MSKVVDSVVDVYRKVHTKDLQKQGIPGYMRPSMVDYLLFGHATGSFLTALLENDLMGAYRNADENNLDAMHRWVHFLYNDVPMTCRGSKEAVEAWRASGGLHGQVTKNHEAQAKEALDAV